MSRRCFGWVGHGWIVGTTAVVLAGMLAISLGGCPPMGGTTGGGTTGGGTTGGGTTGGGTTPVTVDVAMESFAFVPKDVTIHVGDSVRWTNREATFIQHTSTSGDPNDGNVGAVWNSGPLDPNSSFTHTFTATGDFEYFCEFHYLSSPAMRHATVTVNP